MERGPFALAAAGLRRSRAVFGLRCARSPPDPASAPSKPAELPLPRCELQRIVRGEPQLRHQIAMRARGSSRTQVVISWKPSRPSREVGRCGVARQDDREVEAGQVVVAVVDEDRRRPAGAWRGRTPRAPPARRGRRSTRPPPRSGATASKIVWGSAAVGCSHLERDARGLVGVRQRLAPSIDEQAGDRLREVEAERRVEREAALRRRRRFTAEHGTTDPRLARDMRQLRVAQIQRRVAWLEHVGDQERRLERGWPWARRATLASHAAGAADRHRAGAPRSSKLAPRSEVGATNGGTIGRSSPTRRPRRGSLGRGARGQRVGGRQRDRGGLASPVSSAAAAADLCGPRGRLHRGNRTRELERRGWRNPSRGSLASASSALVSQRSSPRASRAATSGLVDRGARHRADRTSARDRSVRAARPDARASATAAPCRSASSSERCPAIGDEVRVPRLRTPSSLAPPPPPPSRPPGAASVPRSPRPRGVPPAHCSPLGSPFARARLSRAPAYRALLMAAGARSPGLGSRPRRRRRVPRRAVDRDVDGSRSLGGRAPCDIAGMRDD